MDNQNDDGLEIVAIGSLYRGPWVKKYWSCSRGKDRYPYPVGYQAVRTCAGDTYRMEIHEGSKGPLFLVTAGGKSVAGQTPDIAWDKVNKKNNCRVKIWHGKKFSCKVDGTELFGFRNPLVQRLLRQLVADEHRLTESSLVLSSCKDSLTLQKQNSDLGTFPDLLLELENQDISGKKWKKKRSKAFHSQRKKQKTHDPSTEVQHDSKCESQTRHCEGTVDDLHRKCLTLHKISRKDYPSCDDPVSKTKINVVDWNNKLSFPSPLEEADETCISSTKEERCSLHIIHTASSPPPTLRYDNEGSTKAAEAKYGFTSLESYNSLYDCCQKDGLAKSSDDLFGYKEMRGRDCIVNQDSNGKAQPTSTEPNVLTDYTAFPVHESNKRNLVVANSEVVAVNTCLLHSSNGVEMHMSAEERGTNDMLMFNLQKEEDPPAILKDISTSAFPASVVPLSERFILKSQSEEENCITLGTQYSGSERSDSDIMGREFAKSMMEVLLPQALPLLKFSRRKKANQNRKLEKIKQGASLNSIDTLVKDHEAFNSNDVLCKDGVDSGSSKEPEAALKDQLQALDPHLEVDIGPIIADSLEDDKYADLLISQTPLNVDVSKPDINPVGDCEQLENSNFLDWGFDTLKVCSPKSRQAGECLPLSNAMKAGEFHESVPRDFANNHSTASIFEDRNPKNSNINHSELKGSPLISGSDESLQIVLPKFSNKCHGSVSYASVELMEQKISGSSSNEGNYSLRTDSANLCSVVEVVETCYVGLENDCQYVPENNIPNASFANLHVSCNQEASSIYGQCPSLVDDKMDLLNLECGTLMSETDPRMFVSETSDTPLKHLQGAASSREHALASHDEKGLLCTPFASDAKELDQYKMVTAVGTTNTSVEKLFDKTNFEPPINQRTVVAGNFAAQISSPKGNELINHFCDVDVEKTIIAENILMGISVMDKDAADTAKNEAVMGCTSIPYIREENECELNVAEEQDVLNISRKPDFLSPPTKDCCPPPSCFERPLKVPVESQTNFTRHPSNELVHDQRDDVLLNELKPETFAFNHLGSMSTKSSNSSTSCIDLVSCCMSPIPVSSMLLRKQKSGLLLCVICGLPEEMSRTLFVYELPDKELTEKCPSFHGHAPLHLPHCSYNYDPHFPGERSKIQFVPDGELLVLIDSIRTPWCSKQEFGCLCSVCESASQGSSVKVVSVKSGYMSVLAKLNVVETSHCLLVCEPCYLVAAQKGGKLHVWVMNTTWSMDMEEFTLPYFTDTAIMVELQKMPNWACLIIGHDCVGRFGLWDVSRRVLLAKFSYSGCTVHQFLPFGFFPRQKNGYIPFLSDRHQSAVLRTSELSFWGPSGKSVYSPIESEDVAVWLLVSAVSCDTYWSNHCLEGSRKSYTGCWRLALLVEDMLILGNTVDTWSSAANVLPGYGIIGRIDGHVYLWKLTSGDKVADLNNLKGARVSCIAADASSNTFAVASDDCRVFLYMWSASSLGN